MDFHSLRFSIWYLPQYATERQKSNVFQFHRALDIRLFIDILYYTYTGLF
jgi:hypothetical protein